MSGSSGVANSGAPGGSGAAGSGATACVCGAKQVLYPTGILCTDLVGPNKGQTMKICNGASGFVESALACGELGTYVTCGAITVGPGVSVCQVATSHPLTMQQCH